MKDVVVPRHSSIAGTIVETRQPVLVHDAYGDPRFFADVDQLTGHRTSPIVGAPLEIGGPINGVLQALSKREGQFDREDVDTLLMFASQAAAAIENTGLIEEQRERLTEVILLQDVLLTLSRFIRLDQLLEQSLALLEGWLGYQNCAVLVFGKDRDCPEGRPILIRANLYKSSYMRVDLIDQGIGIRPEALSLAFEDVRQLDNSFTRECGGAGMGLAVSEHLVEPREG